jgi:hypothetical protein
MCTNGVNHNQLKIMLEMTEEQTALTMGWLKELSHLAGHDSNLVAVTETDKAARLLKEARHAIQAAVEAVEEQTGNGQVEVNIV